MAERLALHAYLSEKAHRAWQTLADENGVSVTSLLEHRGLVLAQQLDLASDPTEVEQDLIRAARKVDAERRKRGKARNGVQPD
jgi:hypothetical protein